MGFFGGVFDVIKCHLCADWMKSLDEQCSSNLCWNFSALDLSLCFLRLLNPPHNFSVLVFALSPSLPPSRPLTHSLAKFVQDYDENVLVRLQFDCAALGQRVCDGIMSVQPWLLRWLDAGRVRDSQVLSVVDSIDKSNQVWRRGPPCEPNIDADNTNQTIEYFQFHHA